jgi:hypothetical protein
MVILGIVLLLISGTLFANTYFCLFNKASCGMVEPFYAIPAGALGAVLAIAGAFGISRRRRG